MQDPHLPCGVSQADIDAHFGGDEWPAWAEDYHQELTEQKAYLESVREDQLRRKFSGPYTPEDVTNRKHGGWLDDEIELIDGLIRDIPDLIVERERDEADDLGDFLYEQQQDRLMMENSL